MFEPKATKSEVEFLKRELQDWIKNYWELYNGYQGILKHLGLRAARPFELVKEEGLTSLRTIAKELSAVDEQVQTQDKRNIVFTKGG